MHRVAVGDVFEGKKKKKQEKERGTSVGRDKL